MECNICCSDKKLIFYTCNRCKNSWCDKCEKQLQKTGDKIGVKTNKKLYGCPYCRCAFFSHSIFFTPKKKVLKSTFCIIS